MADSKKYDGSQWEHSLRKLTTATEAIENPLYSDGTAITAYTIKGNTVQSGTPTPSNPVDVNGVGNKTANLLNPNGTWSPPSGQTADVTVSGNSITITGKYYAYTSVPVTANGNYTAKYSATGDRVYVVAYRAQPFTTANMITSLATTGTTINVGNTDTVWLLFYSGDGTTGTTTYSNFMFNEGSVPLDFEPYGYKIPILNGQQTTPVYLTEQLMKIDTYSDSVVSSGTATYVIKKLVLTGDEETYLYDFQDTKGAYVYNVLDTNYLRDEGLCSHYPVSTTQTSNSLWIGVNNKTLYFVGILDVLGISTVTDFKAYLAQQYAAGTPVTVWYVLATPTTESVTAPTIPTTEGANQISIDTTVQPSEFTATWTGWHNASVKEYDGSDWQ